MTQQNWYYRFWFILMIVTVGIVRLALTADHNILALNSPHDEFWYVNNAFNKVWGGTYDQMAFMHLPVYSMWLAMLHLLGIPARLAIDIGWLVAVGYLAYGILKLTQKKWLAALCFVFLAFHPYTIAIFDRALAETFLLVGTTFVIAAGIELWNCRSESSTFRRTLAIFLYAVSFAVAYHTRKEGIVLVVPLLAVAVGSIFDRKRWWNSVGIKTLVVPILFIPLLSTIALGSALAYGNYLKWGVAARYELAAPGYQRAIGALNSIDVGRTPRQITVTKQALSLAFQESPTFHELQPFMEGDMGKFWVTISSPFVSVPGEIGNGWFYWALRDVAASAGWHTDARFADSKYAAIANELERAFETGRLKKRQYSISSFLDPDLTKWLPVVPKSVFDVSQLVVRPLKRDLDLPKEDASLMQLNRYVEVTGHKKLAGVGHITGVNGWIKMPLGTEIGLNTGDKALSSIYVQGVQRPDVPSAYPFSLSVDENEYPTELTIKSLDGKEGIVPISSIKAQQVTAVSGEIQTELGVDSFNYSMATPWSNQWLGKLCKPYQWLGYLFCLSGAICVLLMIFFRRQFSMLESMMLLMMITVIARVALFGILDASSWSGVQARYILPIIPAFACMGVISLAILSGSEEDKEF